MGLFADILDKPPTPKPRRPARPLLTTRQVEPQRGPRAEIKLLEPERFGAIQKPPPLRLKEFTPLSTKVGELLKDRPFAEGFIGGPTRAVAGGLDAIRAAFLPLSVGLEQAKRGVAGERLRPLPVVTRQALEGFPEDIGSDRLIREITELAAAQPLFTGAARLIGRGAQRIGAAQETARLQRPVKTAEEAFSRIKEFQQAGRKPSIQNIIRQVPQAERQRLKDLLLKENLKWLG